jgi:hypothetical protein
MALVVAACGGGENPGTAELTEGVPASDPRSADPEAGTDSLVLVANVREVPLHLLPPDWVDLFHFRFADEILTLAPDESPTVRAFMEGVMRTESRRTGAPDAGLDWLRRLDRVVLAYERDAADVRWRMRQGEAWMALLPSAEAGPLLEREGFQRVPLGSGADPTRWGVGGASAPDTPGAVDGASDPPPIPEDWLARWAVEVRGRS